MGWKRAWNFLWKSDSPWSWLTDFVLAFLLVRFIFFPLLSLSLGTSLPLVVVESGSMEHSGLSFDSWWEKNAGYYKEFNVTGEQFEDYPLSNGFDKGDIILSMGSKNYERGDVVIFSTSTQSTPIIHRLMHQNEDLTFATKGDHNTYQLPQERIIPRENIISKAVFKIPKLGWLKLLFVELFSGFK